MELVGSESDVSLLLSLEDAVYLIFIYEYFFVQSDFRFHWHTV